MINWFCATGNREYTLTYPNPFYFFMVKSTNNFFIKKAYPVLTVAMEPVVHYFPRKSYPY